MIKIRNDGKNNWMSYIAYLEGTHLVGVGASVDEAINLLKQRVAEKIEHLQNIDYTIYKNE